ncbi:MAG: hypothetical protein QOG53_551 [Frankiales bacterium]|nr:hypothetical protein [Frankiales bacterium]
MSSDGSAYDEPGQLFAAHRRRPVPWHIIWLALALVMLFAANGVTVARHLNGGPTTVSVGRLTAAQSKTMQVNDFRIEMTMKISGQGEHAEMHVGGESSVKPRRLLMTLELPGVGGQLEERVIGNTLYARFGDQAVAGGRHWVAWKAPAGQIPKTSSQDPVKALQLLTGTRGSVERVGRTTIDGVRTTHYKAKLDPQTMLDEFPSELKDSVAGQEFVSTVGLIPFDAFITDDNVVRRLKMKMKVEGVSISMEMNLTPLGRPADVRAPSLTDVLTVKSLGEVFSRLNLPS